MTRALVPAHPNSIGQSDEAEVFFALVTSRDIAAKKMHVGYTVWTFQRGEEIVIDLLASDTGMGLIGVIHNTHNSDAMAFGLGSGIKCL